MDVHDIENLDGVKLWIADHDAHVNAWWEQQWQQNRSFSSRLDRLELRIFLIVGMGSVLGGFVGQLLSTKVGASLAGG